MLKNREHNVIKLPPSCDRGF